MVIRKHKHWVEIPPDELSRYDSLVDWSFVLELHVPYLKRGDQVRSDRYELNFLSSYCKYLREQHENRKE